MAFRRDVGSEKTAAPPEAWRTTEAYNDKLRLDALIVGAGLSGCYLLRRLRDHLGLKVKIFEAGSGLGGTWYVRRSNFLRWLFTDILTGTGLGTPELEWTDWIWTEKFPSHTEVRQYFQHVDEKWQLSKDVAFNTKVVSAGYDQDQSLWKVGTEDGRIAWAAFLIMAVGPNTTPHIPDWKGLDTFKGEMHHSSFWPNGSVAVAGKRVAIVGTGASGVQLSQEIGKTAAHVCVFQRTPNLCLPMRQKTYSVSEQGDMEYLRSVVAERRKNPAGLAPELTMSHLKISDISEEERDSGFEALYEKGGFHFWLNNFVDVLICINANRQAYEFWVQKTRARLTDRRKREILAPLRPPHPFGAKRVSLEQDYYETLDQQQHDIVNTRETPIIGFTKDGIITSDGTHRQFDVIALATGYDAVTGTLKAIDLEDTNGITISERWKNGACSYLGMTVSGFPNMFYTYGVHSPGSFANAPVAIEAQCDWIVDVISKMRKEGIKRIVPEKESERKWSEMVKEAPKATLFGHADSWYLGANIPGKPREMLLYVMGLNTYEQALRDALEGGFVGFETA